MHARTTRCALTACFFTCGTSYEFFVPLPITSPSEQIGPNEYIRKAQVFGITISEWKGYRIIDENGDRTEYFAQMLSRIGDVAIMIARE